MIKYVSQWFHFKQYELDLFANAICLTSGKICKLYIFNMVMQYDIHACTMFA